MTRSNDKTQASYLGLIIARLPPEQYAVRRTRRSLSAILAHAKDNGLCLYESAGESRYDGRISTGQQFVVASIDSASGPLPRSRIGGPADAIARAVSSPTNIGPPLVVARYRVSSRRSVRRSQFRPPNGGALVVLSNVRSGVPSSAFEDWYERTHVPELLELGPYHTACRATLVESGPAASGQHGARHLAIYETDDDGLDAGMKALSHSGSWTLHPSYGRVTDTRIRLMLRRIAIDEDSIAAATSANRL